MRPTSGELCHRLAVLRKHLSPDNTSRGLAVHSVLPGRGRRYFDAPLESPNSMVDLYVFPYYLEADLHVLAAGFNRNENQFAYDIALGISEATRKSINRRLSAQGNPILAEEILDSLEYFLEPHEHCEIQEKPHNHLLDAFPIKQADDKISEYVSSVVPNCQINSLDDPADREGKTAVDATVDGVDTIIEVPYRVLYDDQILIDQARTLCFRKQLMTLLASVPVNTDETNTDDYVASLLKKLDLLASDAVNLTPEQKVERQQLIRSVQYPVGAFNVLTDEITKLRQILSNKVESAKIVENLHRYHTSAMCCLPHRNGSQASRILRDPGLGRYLRGGTILMPYASSHCLVKAHSIPSLKPQWQKFYEVEALYVSVS